MATIKDIANKSGFSIATVSRILSGTDYAVSAQTRSIVEKCAAELGYQPNVMARSLRTSTSWEIAVIIPSFANPFYTEALNGIERVLADSGYDMVVYLSSGRQDKPNAIMNSILRRKIAGVIIAGDCMDASAERSAAEYEKHSPVVLLDSPLSHNSDIHGVFFDYKKGAESGVEYLLEKGHEKIALITKKLDRDSRKGVCAGFAEVMSSCIDEDVFESENDDDFQAGMELAGRVTESCREYSAVIANNDAVAAGAISYLISSGIPVPGQISVMGIDDNTYAKMTTPLLTTVRVPSLEMGELAAKCVLDSVKGQKMKYNIYLPSSIVERDSVLDRRKKGEKT